ncbi:trna delta -isopentenylpyrophosphate transferase [Microvirga zambiensis]|uniref:trna delta -isopentenylpyrophosphate transferase n=1 Tax=Microvirga zambiensis TaxID=1402137 RepID=UPI00191D0A4D|nr:trna delta -isopentenylpyrophosphate transferase [Microvirga zambiensis]
MNTTDKKISDTLAKFGEPMAGNVWRVQGTAVIYHKALERIAAQAKITFDEPKIIRAERDECVMQVTGRMGERTEWSVGEALIGVNYRVSGKQAAYVYAMAEKRAKDRVILKLIELSGDVYSEEEADEFKQGRPGAPEAQPAQQERKPANDHSIDPDSPAGIEVALKQKIDKCKTINAVTDLMLHADTQNDLASLSEGIRDQVRDHAKQKLVSLGWPTKKAQ